jgi:hypothetical protein
VNCGCEYGTLLAIVLSTSPPCVHAHSCKFTVCGTVPNGREGNIGCFHRYKSVGTVPCAELWISVPIRFFFHQYDPNQRSLVRHPRVYQLVSLFRWLAPKTMFAGFTHKSSVHSGTFKSSSRHRCSSLAWLSCPDFQLHRQLLRPRRTQRLSVRCSRGS